KAIASMRELGYDLSRHASKSLSDIPAVEYDVAVTMGCGDACPNVRAKQREEWDIPDPKALPPEEVRKVRDQIEQRVKELLMRLGRLRVTPHGRPDAARGVHPSLRGLDGDTLSCAGLCGGRT